MGVAQVRWKSELDLLDLVVVDLDRVSRPKIETRTLSLAASSLISAISPEKSARGRR